MIKEIFDYGDTVILYTRPRRWGKTSNLIMLQHFLAPSVNNTPIKGMFDKLKIGAFDNGSYLKLQGQYSVIFISLKDVKGNNFEEIYRSFVLLIQMTFDQYPELSNSMKLTELNKVLYKKILTGAANLAEISQSLKILTECLYRHYNRKVCVLIDEYDTPINSVPETCREEVTQFLGKLLGSCLKDNPNLEKGILTGILRLAKANILFGLNLTKEYSVLDNEYSQYFGFTEEEVVDLFRRTGSESKLPVAREWYNGYKIGNLRIYNPWSIMNFLSKQGKPEPFWVDTADNKHIEESLSNAGIEIKDQFQALLQDESIKVNLDKYVTYSQIQLAQTSIWTFLVHTGYLTVEKANIAEGHTFECQVKIPNYEIKGLYIRYLKKWFVKKEEFIQYGDFIASLITGNMEKFTVQLKEYLLNAFSYFDVSGKNPEKVYHAFVLGLVADLHKAYIIHSNRESGMGRYDVLLRPRNKEGLGIILKFKSISPDELKVKHKKKKIKQLETPEPESVLQTTAQAALKQIKDNRYNQELQNHDISNQLFLAIVFAGKDLEVAHEIHLANDFNPEAQIQIYKDLQSTPTISPSMSSHVLTELPYYIEKIFGKIRGIRTQVTGLFESQQVTFDIYVTGGEGQCGYHSLPIPYDRQGVVNLLLKNDTKEIRTLVAQEIMEAHRARQIPQKMLDAFKEFQIFGDYQAKADEGQRKLLSDAVDSIDPQGKIITDRQFENVINYLQKKPQKTEIENKHLRLLTAFQETLTQKRKEFEIFCQNQAVFQAFIKEYIAGEGELAFMVGGFNFERPTGFLDAILKCAEPPIRICIWEPERSNPKKVKIVYDGGNKDAPITHIFHTPGRNTHFELMALAEQPLGELQSTTEKNSQQVILNFSNYLGKKNKPLNKLKASARLTKENKNCQ